ncbi:MAG TPA: hypothetical protein VFX73_01345 [Chitinophagaceae bacterium]|nr:hypothetical protein [Chitinophagaceae bacterium]
MAINQNHPFEELNGVKCGIAEKNASPERVAFLKPLLEHNGYEVVVVPSPPPKGQAAGVQAAGSSGQVAGEQVAGSSEQVAAPAAPETFTIGVTDYTFNTTNAIFGRLLRTPDGHVVTRDYWLQRSAVALDDVPYYETLSQRKS